MDFDFPADALMLQEMLRRFIQKEVMPLEMKYFTSRSLEDKERARLRQAIDQMGLWGITVPEEYSGGGLDLVTTCLIEEELGKTFLPLDIGEVPAPLYACRGAQKERYLEPALAGERRAVLAVREPSAADLRPEAWKARATPYNGGYRIQGCKCLSSRPEADDFLIWMALAPEGATAFLLEASRPEIHYQKQDGEILAICEDCQVAAEDLLGEPGGALKIGLQEAHRGWIKLSARYLGLAERLLSMACAHAKEWVSFGAPLASRPAVGRMLAEMRLAIDTCRWAVYHAAWISDEGKKPEEIRTQAAVVRLAAGEMLKNVVERATLIYAGPGPDPQADPRQIAWGLVPPQALEFALEQARAVLTKAVLNLPDEASLPA